ncbi:hypothetical protein Rsub_11045 [Raphidocelis subcapitata]|uniref:Uncharacterized protein n=1 Tax=Raphidocelis subcapitata TaxID=307507 RepID=A0A2V0PMD5_9CHLO|nr:hypothetical protein Rsub_11045 [Raphidocelis subcapitata]|eukprot:GBF98225.1 hypothetical protein Rsub_11045 [Raphidocelis subcapitata]
MRLAMVVHQFRNSAATRAQLQELLLCMGAHLCGALLSRPWAVGLLLSNLDSGAETEPPPGWWERVTKCMGLRPEMIELLLFLQDWWRRSSGALSLKRRALAGRAPDLAGSFGLQHALCARLATLNSQYLVDAVALALMAHVALLTPEQLAEVYIGSWPRLPSASQLFGAVAAAAAGTPAAR